MRHDENYYTLSAENVNHPATMPGMRVLYIDICTDMMYFNEREE